MVILNVLFPTSPLLWFGSGCGVTMETRVLGESGLGGAGSEVGGAIKHNR